MANESTIYLHDGMELPVEDWSQNTHSFDELTKIIRDTHDAAPNLCSQSYKPYADNAELAVWLLHYWI
ncbi:MAG: hypothetical protein ACI38V_07825 [Bacteroides sp.]